MLGFLDKGVRQNLLLWDDKNSPQACLTNLQKDSVFNMNSQLYTKGFPDVLPFHDLPTPIYSDSHTSNDGNNFYNDLQCSSFKLQWHFTSRFNIPHVNFLDPPIMGGPKRDHLIQVIDENFLAMFIKLEKEMDVSDNGDIMKYANYLYEWNCECNHFIEEADSSLEFLTILKTDFVKVATKTNLLHEACEIILDEQSKCVQSLDSINSRLIIFNEFSKVYQKINSPTFNINSEFFSSTLYRIDECIEYLKIHERYKESNIYLARFQTCSAHVLNLLKSYVFEVFSNVTNQVLNLNLQETITENAFVLLYGKFQTKASKVKVYVEMIENKKVDRVEYNNLFNEILQFYFSNRSSLLIPSVSDALKELSTKHSKDLCYFIRSGCTLMVHICEDEHNLFKNFFNNDTILLDEMLENLCMLLYDALRPLIIHVVHMESLTEICSIFQEELMETSSRSQSFCKLRSFKKVCFQMLQDVQERLVYRTNIYIKNEILNYSPSSGDLAYPEKLSMMKEIAQQNSNSHEENNEGILITDQFSSSLMTHIDLHAMWYPTVKRTLTVLSKLYRSVDKSIFQGLSQDVLCICVQSLICAKSLISSNKSQLDAELFFIKHLLILREQIIPFHIDNIVKETSIDFSKIKNAAVDLLKSRSNLFALNNNNALLQFLLEGTPSFYEKQFDCRKVVDDYLKKSCEEFIRNVTILLVGNLQEFLGKISIVKNKALLTEAMSLKSQPFASPDNVKNMVSSAYRTLKQEQPVVLKLMSLYLANDDTEYILFKPIKSNVLQTYQQLEIILKEHYTEEDMFLIAAPSIDQISILMNYKVDFQRNF